VPKARLILSGIYCPRRVTELADVFVEPERSLTLLFNIPRQEQVTMHFCMIGQYTPKSLNSIMENPKTNRYEAAKNLCL
jgi:hypothetical protein